MDRTSTPTPSATSEIERRNIALYPRSWAVVDEVNERYDLGNVSAAMRVIISEYIRLAEQEQARLQMSAQ